MRQLHLQLLPAMSSHAVIVLEGPHDVAALTELSQRRRNPPAAYGVRLVDGGGGHGTVPKVCRLARQMGFRVIAGLDYDGVGSGADTSFTELQQIADDVARLPEGFAIERALVHGIDRQVLIKTMTELDTQWGLICPGLTTSMMTSSARKPSRQSNRNLACTPSTWTFCREVIRP